MANFTFSSLFDVGDKVFLKSNLDDFLDTTGTMEGFLSFDGNKLIMTVEEIVFISYLETNNSGQQVQQTKILYNLKANNYIPNPDYTAVDETVFVKGIEETNLYSYDEGKTKINEKIASFQNYLNIQ